MEGEWCLRSLQWQINCCGVLGEGDRWPPKGSLPCPCPGRMSGNPLGGLGPNPGLFPLNWFAGDLGRRKAGPSTCQSLVSGLAFLLP